MKNVYICVEACRKRSLDAQKIRTYFIKNNYTIVDNIKKAELIIFVCCGFLDDVATASLKKIKELQKYKAELIVVGCLPEIEKEKLAKIFNGETISTKNLNKIDGLFPENKITFSSLKDENLLFQNTNKATLSGAIKSEIKKMTSIYSLFFNIQDHIQKQLSYKHSTLFKALSTKSYHLRISWGCNGNCSYCAIRPAIGPFRSKPLDEILTEFTKGLEQGYTNFVFESDDVGAYGIDIQSSFPELLDKLTTIPGTYEISIRALSPQWIVKYINDFDEILKRKKIVSIGIAMQSVNSRILQLMHRYSNVEKVKEACIHLRDTFPYIAFDSHYISGFPTETEEEFIHTLTFIQQLNFPVGYIIPFSLKTGTEAEKIEPKIPKKEMKRRLRTAKKFLKHIGYRVIYYNEENCHILLFNKSTYVTQPRAG